MMLRLTGALLFAGSLCAAAAADTIHLTSGGVMRHARVVAEHGDTVVVELRVGPSLARVVVARADVLKIERDAPPEPAADASGRPRRPGGLINAFALLQALRPVEAEVQLTPFLTHPTWQAEARYGLSLAREQTGDLDAAEQQQRLAGLLDPSHAWITFQAAHLLHRRGRLPAAIAAYTRALALEPENPRLRGAVREGVAAARAGRVPVDPAVQRRRRDLDPAAGSVGDAAEAATAVRGNTQLELRSHLTGLRVLLTAPAQAVRAFADGGTAGEFRASVGALRAVVHVNAAWLRAPAKDRSMCLRQIHSALGHRYPHADTVVEAFAPAADVAPGTAPAGSAATERLVGAAWFRLDQVLVRLWPEPGNR